MCVWDVCNQAKTQVSQSLGLRRAEQYSPEIDKELAERSFFGSFTPDCVCVHTSAHAGQRSYVTFNSLFCWELFCVSMCALGAHKNVFTQMFACVVCLEFFLPGRYIFARLLEFISSLCLCLSLSLSPTALAVTSKAWLLWKEPYHWLDASTPTSFPLRVSLRQPL